MILHHYTSETAYRDIIASNTLRPSLRANNPKDARYGDGQYLSDIRPRTRRPGQLSYLFLGIPYQGRKFTHYITLNTIGLHVIKGREHVFVVLNRSDLDISNRIVMHGPN